MAKLLIAHQNQGSHVCDECAGAAARPSTSNQSCLVRCRAIGPVFVIHPARAARAQWCPTPGWGRHDLSGAARDHRDAHLHLTPKPGVVLRHCLLLLHEVTQELRTSTVTRLRGGRELGLQFFIDAESKSCITHSAAHHALQDECSAA
jgi:hypothetical protein